MVAYCIDGKQPTRYDGQCCTQCPGEMPAKKCTYNTIPYQHGQVIKQQNNIVCYCQDGGVECRQFKTDVLGEVFGDGTYIYIIIAVVAVVLILGTLLCCGCTVFFYYYYQRNSQAILASYQQYWNSGVAGWQPMTDEQVEEGGIVEDKQAEAERGQFESEAYLNQADITANEQGQQQQQQQEVSYPPPYALYNGAYQSEEKVHKL